LSEREREVLGYIARGFTNSEIAAELVLSGATVKSHVAHLLRKTDSRDRVRLVILAFESGLAQATASLGDTSESAA
jgi:DNA-binding NarL/FixJ family response regulator